MESKQLLKNKLLKMKKSVDNIIGIVEYSYDEKIHNEANLKLDNIIEMLIEWSSYIIDKKI